MRTKEELTKLEIIDPKVLAAKIAAMFGKTKPRDRTNDNV